MTFDMDTFTIDTCQDSFQTLTRAISYIADNKVRHVHAAERAALGGRGLTWPAG